MRNRFAKISQVTVLVCIFIMLFTLVACKENFNYNVKYYDYNNCGVDISEDFFQRIDSVAEMSTLCSQIGLSIYDKNSLYYDSDFYKELRSYGKSFFRSKSLIMVAKVKSAGYWRYEFGNLKVADGAIIISLLGNGLDEERDLPSVMTSYVWLIEIEKDLIDDINQVVVNEYRLIK